MALTIQQKDLTTLYTKYSELDLESFREYCKVIVSKAKIPNHELLHRMDQMRTKDQLVQSTSNFAMKGHGMGVI